MEREQERSQEEHRLPAVSHTLIRIVWAIPASVCVGSHNLTRAKVHGEKNMNMG